MKSFFRAHLGIGIVVFLTGLINLYSALFNFDFYRLRLLYSVAPYVIIHASRTFILLSGLFLILLSVNIFRRKYRAWLLTCITLSVSIILHLTKGLNYEEAAIQLLMLVLLFISKPLFTVASGWENVRHRLSQSLLLLLFLFVYAFFGFYLYQGQFSQPITLNNIVLDYSYTILGVGRDTLIPHTHPSQWFENSISYVSLAIFIYSVWIIFSPLLSPKTILSESAKDIFKNHVFSFGQNAVSPWSLMPDKNFYYSDDFQTLIAHKTLNDFRICLGDPIYSSPNLNPGDLNQFLDQNQHQGLKTVFYSASQNSLPFFAPLGYHHLKIGEEAAINIADFDLQSSTLADIRHAVNRQIREQVNYVWKSMADLSWKQIQHIDQLYKNWLQNKPKPILTFSLNFYPLPIYDESFVLLIYSPKQTLWGFLTFYPYLQGKGMSVDFLIHSSDSPPGTIEAAIAEAIRYFSSNSLKILNLGMVITADNVFIRNFQRFYNSQSLYKFKKKFSPHWEPKYLTYPHTLDLPGVVLAVLFAHTGTNKTS